MNKAIIKITSQGNLLTLEEESIGVESNIIDRKRYQLIYEMPPIDWEQRRYEIAKAAITGFRSNAGLNETEDRLICKWSITIADELIKQLKESK